MQSLSHLHLAKKYREHFSYYIDLLQRYEVSVCVCDKLKLETKGRRIGRLQFSTSGFTMKTWIGFLWNGKFSQKRNMDEKYGSRKFERILLSTKFYGEIFQISL